MLDSEAPATVVPSVLVAGVGVAAIATALGLTIRRRRKEHVDPVVVAPQDRLEPAEKH